MEKEKSMLDTYTKLIKKWHKDRFITIHGNSMTQAVKTLEEVSELLHGVNRKDKRLIEDSIFDVWVTMVAIAELEDIDLYKAFAEGWKEIKDRKGILDEAGSFIKESDPRYPGVVERVTNDNNIRSSK